MPENNDLLLQILREGKETGIEIGQLRANLEFLALTLYQQQQGGGIPRSDLALMNAMSKHLPGVSAHLPPQLPRQHRSISIDRNPAVDVDTFFVEEESAPQPTPPLPIHSPILPTAAQVSKQSVSTVSKLVSNRLAGTALLFGANFKWLLLGLVVAIVIAKPQLYASLIQRMGQALKPPTPSAEQPAAKPTAQPVESKSPLPDRGDLVDKIQQFIDQPSVPQ